MLDVVVVVAAEVVVAMVVVVVVVVLPPLAAATAAAAFAMPDPQLAVVHEDPAGNGVALACSIADTWSGLSESSTDNISDTIPATCGAAMLVP